VMVAIAPSIWRSGIWSVIGLACCRERPGDFLLLGREMAFEISHPSA